MGQYTSVFGLFGTTPCLAKPVCLLRGPLSYALSGRTASNSFAEQPCWQNSLVWQRALVCSGAWTYKARLPWPYGQERLHSLLIKHVAEVPWLARHLWQTGLKAFLAGTAL